MVNINLRILTDSCSYSKNVLYKIDIPRTVVFVEKHGKSCEKVYLEYALQGRQFGIFAHEYRNPVTEKEGTKRADILCSLVDPDRKEIHTDIFDVKSNISAFSDDLAQDNAMTFNVLRPYEVEAQKIRDFARRSVHICGKDYKLYVFILEESCKAEYVKTIKVGEH